MQNEAILEIVHFGLRNPIGKEAFVDAVENDYFLSVNGYIEHELIKANDAEWMDIVHYRSIEEAREAVEDAALNVTCRNYSKMMWMSPALKFLI